MNIEVTFFGKLRELAGVYKEVVQTVDVVKLSELVTRLGETHGGAFAKELIATKGLRILVNGQEYQLLAGMETSLRDNDSVTLLPPVEGG